MKEVGDKFGAGELILPFVLQSAEVMKRSVAHLEQYLEKVEGVTKGKVILATVYGDVHDIGKSLVNTILSNNGYTVYDLGKQVPVNVILDKAVEVEADAIGLSALLVSTSSQMPLCVQELHRRGLTFPVIIGGAAINRALRPAHQLGRREPGDALRRRGLLLQGRLRGPLYRRPAASTRAPARPSWPACSRRCSSSGRRSARGPRRPAPGGAGRPDGAPLPGGAGRPGAGASLLGPPHRWHRTGASSISCCPTSTATPSSATTGSTPSMTGPSGSAWWTRSWSPACSTLWADARVQRWLSPRAIYGYYPVQADGNDLVVYDPAAYAASTGTPPGTPGPSRSASASPSPARRRTGRSATRTSSAWRTTSGRWRAGSGRGRLPGGHRRRGGQRVHRAPAPGRASTTWSWRCTAWPSQAAEAHGRVRPRPRPPSSCGSAQKQGQRYSWGYPACPDLEDQAKLFRLLPGRRSRSASR